jgi:hypothetical protein
MKKNKGRVTDPLGGSHELHHNFFFLVYFVAIVP